MQRMSWDDPGVDEACALVLRGGGIVLHPTETCYGLAVDVFNEGALTKLYGIKKMSRDKPVSILVRDLAMAEKFGRFNGRAMELAWEYWPGPLSIVVERKGVDEGGLPEFVNFGETTVSLRCSSMAFCMNMLAAFDGAVSTTSANVTGEPQAYVLTDLDQAFLEQVDLVVDGGSLPVNMPSTIVKVNERGVEVLRQGDLVLTDAELAK